MFNESAPNFEQHASTIDSEHTLSPEMKGNTDLHRIEASKAAFQELMHELES